MENREISERFMKLSTPLVADACIRLKLPLRIAPSGIQPILSENRVAGRVLPVRHFGSVAIFGVLGLLQLTRVRSHEFHETAFILRYTLQRIKHIIMNSSPKRSTSQKQKNPRFHQLIISRTSWTILRA